MFSTPSGSHSWSFSGRRSVGVASVSLKTKGTFSTL